MSKKRDKEFSLSEKLSSLIQSKPSFVESDDEDLTTVDKIAITENQSDYSADELDVPKFRKVNNSFLDEDDSKYLGKGVSRKDLKEDSDVDEAEDEISTDEFDDEEKNNESEGSDNDEVSSNDATDSEQKEKIQISPKESNDFNKEIFTKASGDIEKGKGIKNQLHIWDFLLECRMKFQNCLAASNQFPAFYDFMKFKNAGGSEFQEYATQSKKSLKHLLNSLLSLQEVLLKSNEEFTSSTGGHKTEIKSDEEITSDSESEEEKTKQIQIKRKKLNGLDDFSNEISKRHQNFQTFQNNTIQKWNDKTRIGYISNKNFSAFEQSTLKQIEHILVDKQRLIKRTQTKRSNYHILGQVDEPPTKAPKLHGEDPLGNLMEGKNKDLHKEIFDDDDFYHQLLSELVKRKASDVTDPVQLGRQWMQLQKIRSKMKKTVDVKASKGRKIRFVVHPKLVNFMTPINNSTFNEDSKTELFNSLFGKNKK